MMESNMYNAIRLWFTEISKCVKLNYYMKQLDIKPSNMTLFLKGVNGSISYYRLIELQNYIIADLGKKIA